MRIERDESAEEATVQMAPLIDCVFLLLIFFLVAATLKKAHKELEIALPHAAASIEKKTRFETLIIEVTQDGTVHIDSEPLSTQLLHKTLREAAMANPDRRVRIDADRRAAWQHIVHVLDLCQFNKLQDVGVRTRD